MRVIGLTGGFGTGKSTVAAMFKKLGARVLSADEAVHRHLNANGKCYKKIVEAFGPSITRGGKIDKRKLADVIFKNNRQRKVLEGILHPVVRKEFKEKINRSRKTRANGIIILEVPLLFETDFHKLVDVTAVVHTTRARQLKRIQDKTKISKAEAMRRIKAQKPLSLKRRLADLTIDNNHSIKQTEKQVKRIWQRLQMKKI